MFTSDHFIWLGLSAAFVTCMLIFSIKRKLSLKTSGYIMTVICAFSEISKIMGDMTESDDGGMHLDPGSLPFHLCSLLLFTVLFVTFGKEGRLKQTVIDFLAVAGVLGSLCALLIPTNGTDFAKLGPYQCFVYHAGLMWFALYLIATKKANPGLRTYGRNLVILLALVLAMIYVNSVLSVYDTNFMYLVRPPMENLPYLNLNAGWYAYFLRLVALGVAIISLFHLPFIIAERKNK
ncbi:MAG: hypothetical protein E7628_01650 [Ruminococcaceae bacterium]|nr:hypothetical protein [Oscillospiraceae bacterium]